MSVPLARVGRSAVPKASLSQFVVYLLEMYFWALVATVGVSCSLWLVDEVAVRLVPAKGTVMYELTDIAAPSACPLSIEVSYAMDTAPVPRLRIVGAGTCEDPLRVEVAR